MIPGGEAALKAMPVGHGSDKLKAEALDEVVLRVQAALTAATTARISMPNAPPSAVGAGGASAGAGPPTPSLLPPIDLPWCAFNGGRDAWVDVGNKSVGVQAMQAFLGVSQDASLHVGDQVGNRYLC
jgi:hypothetical protein